MNGFTKTGFPSPGKIPMHCFPFWHKTCIPFSVYLPAWKLKNSVNKKNKKIKKNPIPIPVTAGLNKLTYYCFFSVWASLGPHRDATYVL